jgi:hypothetical protein
MMFLTHHAQQIACYRGQLDISGLEQIPNLVVGLVALFQKA